MAHTVRKRSVTQWHYMAHTVWHTLCAAFSAVSFCNGVAKTVEIRKNSKQSHRADDQAKRWEKALHGTHCA